jgi:hypothetical protein
MPGKREYIFKGLIGLIRLPCANPAHKRHAHCLPAVILILTCGLAKWNVEASADTEGLNCYKPVGSGCSIGTVHCCASVLSPSRA